MNYIIPITLPNKISYNPIFNRLYLWEYRGIISLQIILQTWNTDSQINIQIDFQDKGTNFVS